MSQAPSPADGAASRPRIDLIIVTFNSRRYFPRMKAALEALTERFTLHVLDNASEPAQRPQSDDFPAGANILQMERNLGFAAGNNRAAAQCESEFIALLNPDAFPQPDWLTRLLEAAARWPEAVAFGSTQIADEDPSRFDGLGDCYSFMGLAWRGGFGWPSENRAPQGEVFSPCAAAALYRADAWRAVGGFDESFFCYHEDVDLGFRMRLAGGACAQVRDAIVRHVGSASSGRYSHFAVFHGTRNRIWTYFKNMPAPLLWFGLPGHIALTLALLLLAPLRKTTRATWTGVGAGLKHLPSLLRERRRVRRSRRGRSWAIARALSWSPVALLTRAPVVRPRVQD